MADNHQDDTYSLRILHKTIFHTYLYRIKTRGTFPYKHKVAKKFVSGSLL